MLSICIVVYNEEKVLRRCLDSLKGLADEIIVIMDGVSQDRTESICREYANKLFIREHIGFSDPHLPFAFKQAKGDWIMRVDADEFLSPKSCNKIKLLMKNNNIDGYFFLWRLWNGKKYITQNKPHKPVLFRKSKLFFVGVPHGIMQSRGKTKKVNISLEHQPNYNNWTWNIFIKKQVNRAKTHAIFLFKNFKDIPVFNFCGNDYSLSIRIRKYLYFLSPFFAIYKFFTNILYGGKNLEAIKVSFFTGLYELFLGYYIFKNN